MVNKRFVVFDFDGTIAQTEELIVQIYNDVAERFSLVPIAQDDVHHLKGMPTKKALDYLKIDWYRIPKLWRIIVHELAARVHEIQLYDGIIHVINTLSTQSIPYGVISSNSEEVIRSIFDQYQLNQPLFIGTSSALFKKHKVYRKHCSRQNLTVTDSLYIGDETRDIELGQKLDIPVLSVLWGFSIERTLLKAGAKHIIHHPKDLIPKIVQFIEEGSI